MLRWIAGIGALVLLGLGGVLLFFSGANSQTPALPPPPAPAPAEAPVAPMPDNVPAAPAASREERRFNRYDKDRDAAITRAEYLASRRKAFARLDVNGDGRLSFEEWAVKTTERFAKADANRDGAMSRAEFATTAVKRKPAAARCVCPPSGDGDGE